MNIISIIIFILLNIYASSVSLNFTSDQGAIVVNGQRLKIKGINWYTMCYNSATSGLNLLDYHTIIDTLANNQFNVVRLRFTV